MGRSKTPIEKAKLTGADRNHPERFRDRQDVDGGPAIGKPPAYFDAKARAAWARFKRELPWLVESDRAMVELASLTRALIEADPAQASAAMVKEHRQQLASLGATPVTRSNVAPPFKGNDDDDPFAAFGPVQ